jgi:hypothetical protein
MSLDRIETREPCPYLHINHRVDVHSVIYCFIDALDVKVVGVLLTIYLLTNSNFREPFLFHQFARGYRRIWVVQQINLLYLSITLIYMQ